MVNEYRIPAELLQRIVDVLNGRPAGEVFTLLLALKQQVDQQNAAAKATPTLGQNG